MRKKYSVIAFATVMSVLMATSSVSAGAARYSFTLGNTKKVFKHHAAENKKVYETNPQTLKVEGIKCVGTYGIRFAPAKILSATRTLTCNNSGMWKSGTGYSTKAYASGDAVAGTTYKLAARQDDSYNSVFTASGWWNADKLKNQ